MSRASQNSFFRYDALIMLIIYLSLSQVDLVSSNLEFSSRLGYDAASSSRGVSQAALGILRACYVSWLHQDWSSSGGATQPALGVLRVCYTSWLHQNWSSSGGATQAALCTLRACYPSWLHQDWRSSGGATQAALGILRVCYTSWLHQDWRSSVSSILVQLTDITRTHCTKFCFIAPPEYEQVMLEIWTGT
jgi:hypothetical protein